MQTRIGKIPQWQQQRAAEIHLAFLQADKRIRIEQVSAAKAIRKVCDQLKNKVLRKGDGFKALPVSFGNFYNLFKKWTDGGQKIDTLFCSYKPGMAKIPTALVTELHRRATLPGMVNISVVIKSLQDDWASGREIPGLGTWEQYWANNYPDIALPPVPPEFPISARTLHSWKPNKRQRALGTKGIAAFKGESAFVSLDYSQLRKCELFTLDDVRLDVLCIDEATSRPIRVVCYILMEVASRSIVAYILKPNEAIKQEDVDELLAYGLQKWGIGDGYTTHIKFERGTVACSVAAQTTIEAASEGGIKIHRTSMNGGIRWIGAPADKRSGHAAGKAVIESFNRKLHLALMPLPGQRGSNWKKAPANLGYESAEKVTPGSLIDQAQKLAQFQVASGNRVSLNLGMLYLKQLDAAVREAIKKHNTEPGHDYQGHGTFEQREVMPGVWQESISPLRPHQEECSSHLTQGVPQTELRPQVATVETSGATSGAVKKIYQLDTPPAPTITVGQYWAIWKNVEKVNPKISRHALTQRTLGYHPKVSAMTNDELAKMLRVFAAIIRDAKATK